MIRNFILTRPARFPAAPFHNFPSGFLWTAQRTGAEWRTVVCHPQRYKWEHYLCFTRIWYWKAIRYGLCLTRFPFHHRGLMGRRLTCRRFLQNSTYRYFHERNTDPGKWSVPNPQPRTFAGHCPRTVRRAVWQRCGNLCGKWRNHFTLNVIFHRIHNPRTKCIFCRFVHVIDF